MTESDVAYHVLKFTIDPIRVDKLGCGAMWSFRMGASYQSAGRTLWTEEDARAEAEMNARAALAQYDDDPRWADLCVTRDEVLARVLRGALPA